MKTFNSWIINEKIDNPNKATLEFKIPKNNNIDISVYFVDLYPPSKKNNTETDSTSQIHILENDTTKIKEPTN